MQKKHRKILEPNCCEALDNAKVHQHSTFWTFWMNFWMSYSPLWCQDFATFWLIAGFLLAKNSKVQSLVFFLFSAWFIVEYEVYSHLSWFIGVFFRWLVLQHFSFRTEKLREQGTVYFCFCSWTKNRNKLTWLNICVYIYIKPLQISRVSFFLRCFFFFFVTFFFFQLVTNRAVLLNSQNSEASNGAEKNLRFNGFASPFANFNQVEKCEWRTDFFGDKELRWRFGMTYFLDVWMILCEIWKV